MKQEDASLHGKKPRQHGLFLAKLMREVGLSS
jgi:hypothetical protein